MEAWLGRSKERRFEGDELSSLASVSNAISFLFLGGLGGQDYAVTAKTIREKVTALNIQIGNLWFVPSFFLSLSLSLRRVALSLTFPTIPLRSSSFMPQERVAQFAEMSPQELLRQTQKAAGPAQMTEWHEKLIELTKEGKEVGKVS